MLDYSTSGAIKAGSYHFCPHQHWCFSLKFLNANVQIRNSIFISFFALQVVFSQDSNYYWISVGKKEAILSLMHNKASTLFYRSLMVFRISNSFSTLDFVLDRFWCDQNIFRNPFEAGALAAVLILLWLFIIINVIPGAWRCYTTLYRREVITQST